MFERETDACVVCTVCWEEIIIQILKVQANDYHSIPLKLKINSLIQILYLSSQPL